MSGLLPVAQADRELFIFLMGFDAVPNEGGFDRILAGEFDGWKKMQAIAAHREAHTAGLRDALKQASEIAERAPELNMSNYDEEQVAALNADMVELCLHLRTALSEHGK